MRRSVPSDLPDADTDHGAADVTLLDEERDHCEREPAEPLREDAAAVRRHVRWPGLRRTLSAEQKDEVAGPFDAESGSLSASKKLLDTTHPALRAAAKVRRAAVSHWKSASLPYPEAGVRLLPRTDLPPSERRMTDRQAELADAAAEVDRYRDELVSRARRRRGDLFVPADDPPSLAPRFGCPGTCQRSNRRIIRGVSRPACTNKNATRSGNGSSRPWNWPEGLRPGTRPVG